jgi:hypothetical protein
MQDREADNSPLRPYRISGAFYTLFIHLPGMIRHGGKLLRVFTHTEPRTACVDGVSQILKTVMDERRGR